MVQKLVEVNSSQLSQYVSVATYLPVKYWWNLFAFMRLSSRIEEQLRKSEGILRYGLRTDLSHKKFWTFSVWEDHESVSRFVYERPHTTAVEKFSLWHGKNPAFVEWENADGKVD